MGDGEGLESRILAVLTDIIRKSVDEIIVEGYKIDVDKVVLIECDDQWIAGTTWLPQGKIDCYVTYFYVIEEYHRQGVGTVMAEALQEGQESILLGPRDDSARMFWEKMGFKRMWVTEFWEKKNS